MIVRKITQYIGNNGERIEELRAIDGESGSILTDEQKASLAEDDAEIMYLGLVIIPVGVNDSSGQMIDVRPQELRFPIDATNLKEAFEKFDTSAENAVKDLKKRSDERTQQRDSGLVVPNAAESEVINKMKLFVPD